MVPRHFKKILKVLTTQEIDGLLLNTEANVSYAAGFPVEESYALVSRKGICILADFRYAADLRQRVKPPVRVLPFEGSVFEAVSRLRREENIKRIGFESRHLPFAECEILNRLLSKKALFIPLAQTLEPSREIKDTEEVRKIKKAVRITRETFKRIKNTIRPGQKESAIAGTIEKTLRTLGADGAAFKTIVASGPNASYPHARVTQRRLKTGDTVVIDMGARCEGYNCDLTRTYFLGKIKPVIRQADRIVKEAQRKAILAIRPGMPIKDLDAVARNFIAEKGFGKNFGHALGHGVGLEVHESPSINKNNHNILREGMVLTIEPGIYAAGQFGIRMEEMVRVTHNGAEVFSGNDKH